MGWLGQWRSLVLYPLVMSFKEEVKLLVKPRPDIGSAEVHDLFSLQTPGWPCISHASLGQSLLPYPVGGWCPLWGSCLDELSTTVKHPLESVLWSKIRKVFFIHMFFHPSCLSGCGAFISSDEEQGFCHSCSVFKNKKHWRLSLQAYALLKSISILGVFSV